MMMKSDAFLLVLTCLSLLHYGDAYDLHEYEFNPVALAGYMPEKVISDFAAVDLDLKAMKDAFADVGTADSFAAGGRLYREGAYSRPYARLHLDGGLTETLYAGEWFVGYNQRDRQIYAQALHDQKQGHTVIVLEYFVDDQISVENRCEVGANPRPNTNGCFPSTGNVTVLDDMRTFPYWYDPLTENLNERTFQGFSRDADRKMKPCGSCDYFMDFRKYFEYYGAKDFADRFITGAIDGTRVQLQSGRPMDFTKFNLTGRARAIELGAVTMSLSHAVVRELEMAIHYCHYGKTDSAIKAVDIAAAFYVGHLEGADGRGDGHLLYDLADTMCREFKTCGERGTSTHGTSRVNRNVLRDLGAMHGPIRDGNCATAKHSLGPVSRQMRVPYVQGLLRAVYRKSQGTASDADEAEAAVLKASLIPLIAHCHAGDAEAIEDAVGDHGHATDFATFKEVLERQYDCLGIEGGDVGGYWDARHHRYHEGAEPYAEDGETKGTGHALLLHLLWFVFLPAFACWFCCCRPKRKSQEDEYLDDLSKDSEDDDYLMS